MAVPRVVVWTQLIVRKYFEDHRSWFSPNYRATSQDFHTAVALQLHLHWFASLQSVGDLQSQVTVLTLPVDTLVRTVSGRPAVASDGVDTSC